MAVHPRSIHKTTRNKLQAIPVFPGWYADPEGAVFNKEFWIYPTYSAPYNEQVFFDAFSSRDLVNWEKHSRITDTTKIKWVKTCVMGTGSDTERKKIFFILWCQ
jgi:hypothetical protein